MNSLPLPEQNAASVFATPFGADTKDSTARVLVKQHIMQQVGRYRRNFKFQKSRLSLRSALEGPGTFRQIPSSTQSWHQKPTQIDSLIEKRADTNHQLQSTLQVEATVEFTERYSFYQDQGGLKFSSTKQSSLLLLYDQFCKQKS
jgi:hypothetical protein